MFDNYSCPAFPRILERLRRDMEQRGYTAGQRGSGSWASDETESDSDFEKESMTRLRKLPAEIGVLMIVVGIAGIILPGPVGSPFLVAGGIILWPAGFRKMELWMHRRRRKNVSHRNRTDRPLPYRPRSTVSWLCTGLRALFMISSDLVRFPWGNRVIRRRPSPFRRSLRGSI